ncbi:MAG: 2-oxoglutarate dehydrogenase complex dihydrolipoyllysine-residue succinyltransferase [Myxococcales bacterium]|nr:2-oxoglutarate dehydrogenase complex dihydrolipoyllysine-residue succinyltransferase [Myxococcales bacterium]
MSIDLKVPPVGESITEVVIGQWLKNEGDFVAEDEPVVVVESDKVNMEVPAPKAGVLVKVLLPSGATARIGEVLGELEPGEAPARNEAVTVPAPKAASTSADEAAAPRVTPAARRVLAEHGLTATEVPASGPGGRLLKEDVLRHVEAGKGPAAPAAPAPSAPVADDERGVERARMSPLRRTVARRLVEAQQSAALLTTFNEVDMSAVMALRETHKQAFIDRYEVKLGFMSFFVKAVIEGLKAFPALNARIDGDEIVYHHYHDIGVAVGGGRGLVVPVIRNAERLSFAEIEQTIGDLGRRARDNKLKLEELTGGTFSITNGGVYGSLLSTPIINPPQSGILGMHGIFDRPVAVDGQVVIRPMMYIALTYDHRIVDGREAVSFLRRVKECIEAPVRMLLEV